MFNFHLCTHGFICFCRLQDPEFQPDLVASKSYAAAGLCSWVLNIVKFYEVYCEVEPKRQALSKANTELAAAQEKLAAIKSKINVSHCGGLWIQEMKSFLIYAKYLFQKKKISISKIRPYYITILLKSRFAILAS